MSSQPIAAGVSQEDLQRAFLDIALRLTLSQRRSAADAITLLEGYLGLPNDLLRDQRGIAAGPRGKQRKENNQLRRVYYVHSRMSDGGVVFTLADAAFIMGVAESTLMQRTVAGKEFSDTRENPYAFGHDDVLTCRKVEEDKVSISQDILDWLEKKRIAKKSYSVQWNTKTRKYERHLTDFGRNQQKLHPLA